MKSLRARLARVEAELQRWNSPPTRPLADLQLSRTAHERAIHELFDVLKSMLGGPRPDGYGRRSYIEGAVEVAGRIDSGRLTDADRALILALPAHQLALLGDAGVSAEEFVRDVAELAEISERQAARMLWPDTGAESMTEAASRVN